MSLASLCVIALFLSGVPSGGAFDQPPDGYTASITLSLSAADTVLVPQNGRFTANVQIFSNESGAWQPIVMRATLRVFEDSLTGGIDRISIPFTSSVAGPVAISFPDVFGQGTLDVFVTFSELGGNPVPTSHHHLAKNRAIAMGDFATADNLDHHSTRVWST